MIACGISEYEVAEKIVADLLSEIRERPLASDAVGETACSITSATDRQYQLISQSSIVELSLDTSR